MRDRLYLDPGDRLSGRNNPSRLCRVLARWRQAPRGEKTGPRNVRAEYLDDRTTAVIPFPRRLRRADRA